MGPQNHLEDGRDETPKRKPFDVFTQLALPSLLVAATIVSVIRDQRSLAWALVWALVLSLVVSYYAAVASWAKTGLQRYGDKRIARRAFPELRNLVEQFGELVSRQRGDTLHYIAQSDLCGGYPDRFSKLAMPNIDLFGGFLYNLRERAANQKPTPADLKATNSELGTLVISYNNYCMNAIFELLPQELRSQLTDKAKSNLEACRERFVAFLDDYSKYLKHFDERFATRYGLSRQFPRPKPLL